MNTVTEHSVETDQQLRDWQRDIFDVLCSAQIRHISYVPDGGHKGLIELCRDHENITTTILTTEEEGIGLSAGLALAGQRSALLMQSSGFGNCVNMFSLAESCRFPLLLLITMRGEWAEAVPWQVPTGKRTPGILEMLDFDIFRVDHADEAGEQMLAAIDQAYLSDRRVAVLLSQRLIGRKNWDR